MNTRTVEIPEGDLCGSCPFVFTDSEWCDTYCQLYDFNKLAPPDKEPKRCDACKAADGNTDVYLLERGEDETSG